LWLLSKYWYNFWRHRLTFPVDGDIDVPVGTDLYWNPVANAEYYRLSIGTVSGTYTILTNGFVGNVTTYDIAADLPEGTVIYVLIVPYNSAGDSIGCIEESFTTIQNCNITVDSTFNYWKLFYCFWWYWNSIKFWRRNLNITNHLHL